MQLKIKKALEFLVGERLQNNGSNRKIQLIIDDEVQIYKIFSIYKIDPEEYYITTKFDNKEEYDTFVTTIMGRSLYDFKENKSDMNKILTLSTCVNSNNMRLVVHAYKIDE